MADLQSDCSAPRVVAVGEILWDLLPDGAMLGGAPTNFAVHAHSLGAQVQLVSRIGDDTLGRDARAALEKRGLDTRLLQVDPERPTGTVSVHLDGGHPTYVIHENVAWDAIRATDEALQVASQCAAICFGSLGQRSPESREAIHRLVADTPPTALRIFDINLRQHFYDEVSLEHSLRATNVLKLNDSELPVLAGFFSLSGSDETQVRTLARMFDFQCIALTRGARGSLILIEDQAFHHPGVPAEVKDTIGAGDSFTAALALGLLHGESGDVISQRANEVAAFVCGNHGATPELPEQFRGGRSPVSATR